MTEKLYYLDSHMREFDACVLRCEQEKKGWAVVLDRTAFYPEGGGQACDLGVLGGAKVLDVRERGEEIVHLCDAPLEAGAQVRGAIDWERRFDLMQQHSGEHLVSGLMHEKYGCDNVGFHMGKDTITIDFNAPVDEEGLREIERKANEAVWANLETDIFYPSREELAALPYRSKKELAGQVRLVRFPGVDLCACCGTHVKRTGEIGIIQLFSCVKFHDGVRIEMLSGKRCLDYLRKIYEQNRETSVTLSAKPLETGSAVKRVYADLNEAKQRIGAMELEAFRAKAESLRGAGDVLLFEAAMAPDSVRTLCDAVMTACGGRCAIFAGSNEAGWKYAIGGGEADLRPLCKELNTALSGRGGGKPNFVQGSAAATRAEIEAFFSVRG